MGTWRFRRPGQALVKTCEIRITGPHIEQALWILQCSGDQQDYKDDDCCNPEPCIDQVGNELGVESYNFKLQLRT